MERAWQREQHYWLLHNIAIEYTAKIITGELNTPSETQTEIEQNQFRIRIHDPAPRIDLLRADNRVFFLALREEPTDIARLLQRMRRFPQRRNVQLGSTFSQRLSSAGFSSEQITCVLMKWRTIELRAPQKSPPEEDNTLPQTGSFFHIEVSPLSPDAPQWGYDLFFVVNRERASMVHYTDEFFYLPEVRNECDAPATR